MTEADIINRFRTADEKMLGNIGERILSSVFRSSGYHYIPLSKIDNGGAPMIESSAGKVILPDFDVTTGQFGVFVDAKCKSGPVLWRKANQLRHGIDRKNWMAYLRCGELYRKRCGIAIIELFADCNLKSEWSGSLLVESLNNLGEPWQGESNQRHMVYWRRKQFSDLESFSPAQLMDLAQGKLCRSFAFEFERIFHPPTQREMF